MEIVKFINDVTKEDVVNATQDQLDALLTRVWNERQGELQQRFKIKGLAELRKQVEVAMKSTRNTEPVGKESASQRAREDADNNERKSWWKDYVVSPKDVPLIGGIPILSHAAAAVGTVITAKPVGGLTQDAVAYLFRKISGGTGREGWKGTVGNVLGTAARIAAVWAMGHYGFKLWNHIKGVRADAAVNTIQDVQDATRLANPSDPVTYGGGSAASGSTGVAPNVIDNSINTAPISPQQYQ